jgi:magnesium transporter
MNPTAALLEPEIRELVQEGRYNDLREILHDLPNADVADILAELDPEKAALAFRFLPHDDAAETFAYLPPEKQEDLIDKMGAESSVRIVESMSADDRARLIDELPAECSQRIIARLSPESRRVTQAILGYPPKSVGRLMTPDYIALKPEWTIKQAIDFIRTRGRDAETINVIYVIDADGKLIDDIRIRQFFLADPNQTVESLMNRSYYWLTADQPQSEAVDMMRRYDRTALPVVDSRGHLVGIVTHDDVADVAEEQVTEDIHKLGAVSALDEPYMATSLFALFKKRAPWLALLFVSELLTSNAIGFYEDEIKRAAILAAFIPGIISSGGNSGSQASTLVIRAMGLREIDLPDWWRVLRRELAVAAMLGLMLGAIGFCRVTLFGSMGWFSDPDVADHYIMLAITISSALIGIVVWGSIMGSMLPFIMKKLKLDPAGSSAPFVATVVDVTGIVIYFSCAILILRTTLLNPGGADKALRLTSEVTVISIDGYRPGDQSLEIGVRPIGADDSTPISRVTLPIAKTASPPPIGSHIKLNIATQDATGYELVK